MASATVPGAKVRITSPFTPKVTASVVPLETLRAP
jgi:hypothetical protein